MGLTDLSKESDVSYSTINRWLSRKGTAKDKGQPKSERVLARVLNALEARRPLSMMQRSKFATLSGLPLSVVDPSGTWVRTTEQLRPVAVALRELQARVDAFEDRYRQPIVRVLDLVDEVGEERALAFLKLATVAAGIQSDDAEEQELDIKHPPREVDLGGAKAIEQVTTTYGKSRVAARGRIDHGKKSG